MPELEEKLATGSDTALANLAQVKEALRRNAHIEALKYIGDATAAVQNEIDWCYRTDLVLPHVLQYLIDLGDAVATVSKLQDRWKLEQTKTIIEAIEGLTTELIHITKDAAHWQAPDSTIDVIEQEYRARQYGYSNG